MMKQDKILHVICGVYAAAWVSLPAYLTTNNLFAGLWVALWVGIIAGGIKEFCDMRTPGNKEFCDMRTPGNKWDWWDFGYTCLGAVIVALFIVCLHFGKG